MNLLRLEGVGRSFLTPSGSVRALAPTNLDVRRGEFVAIEGASGSGKSTLLNIVGLLESSSSGLYTIDGRDVAEMANREKTEMRASSFGFVFQSFHLVDSINVIDNVALALVYLGVPRRHRYERARVALRRLGLGHRLTAQPSTLSGGEKQRVAVARAIVGRPDVVLADEPTGNLDRRSTKEVLDALAELHQDGLTVVVVTHDPIVSAVAQRRVVLSSSLP